MHGHSQIPRFPGVDGSVTTNTHAKNPLFQQESFSVIITVDVYFLFTFPFLPYYSFVTTFYPFSL